MRKIIIIVIMVFVSGLGFTQSSYFNMRYRRDNSLANTSKSVCLTGNELFFNMISLSDSTNNVEQTFSRITLIDGELTNFITLADSSIDIFGAQMLEMSDGGYVDVLTTGVLGTLNVPYSIGVVKYHGNGDTQFVNMNTDTALYQTINGNCEGNSLGIAMVGVLQAEAYSQGGEEDLLFIYTDSLGNAQWRKTFGDSLNEEEGHCIKSTSDGGHIIGGLKKKIQTGIGPRWSHEWPWLIKTDSIGTIEWDKHYGPQDTFSLPIYDVTPTQDGGYAFVGAVGREQYIYDAEFLPWIVKVDALGDTLWSRTMYGAGPDQYSSSYRSVIELPDGSLVTCGQQFIPNPDTVNFVGWYRTMGVITKYSAQGDLIWTRNYQHPENKLSQYSDHLLTSIVATPDGGFAAAGYLYPDPPDTGTQDTWVIKVDSFGCLTPGCELSSVPKIESSIAQLNIYPNPANDIVHFDITPNLLLGNQRSYELKLYDMVGRLVLTQTLYPYENTISVGHLKSGVYNYRLGETMGKIVIQF